jgi:hypothetical protein
MITVEEKTWLRNIREAGQGNCAQLNRACAVDSTGGGGVCWDDDGPHDIDMKSRIIKTR